MSRTDGRKLVAFAGAAIVGALGIGTIYLPFVADRDKLRGLFEEGEETIPEGARREIQRIAKIEAEQQKELQQQLTKQQLTKQQQNEQEQDYSLQKQKRASAGGMWSAFKRKDDQ